VFCHGKRADPSCASTRGVPEREKGYKLRAAPNNPVAHLGQAQSCDDDDDDDDDIYLRLAGRGWNPRP
jgi:hypothetical protein